MKYNVIALMAALVSNTQAAQLSELVKNPSLFQDLNQADQLKLSDNLNTSPEKLKDAINNYSTELTEAKISTNENGKYAVDVQLDRYTITLASLFVVQLFFCFVIVGYTNQKVQDSELRNEKQKAEFYKFIYQFHQ